MAPHILFREIWSRKPLCEATVITTTRPTAVECLRELPEDCLNRTVEILGFSFEQVKDYVTKFAESQPTIWEHIQQNANLLSLCYIPVNCFIICHCLLHSPDPVLPVKITEIYSIFVKIFFHKRTRNREAYGCSKCDLRTYMYKPFEDLKPENEKVFKRLGELAFEGIRDGKLIFESVKIDAALLDCELLHILPEIPSNSLVEPPKQHFCFIHLTLQEFLAAKHVTDNYSEEDLKSFVEKHINDGAWQIVTQFVAGLSKIHEVTSRLLPERVADQKEWPVGKDRTLAVNVCHCLYESASKMEAKALVQGDEGAKYIGEALEHENCKLTHLNMFNNNIGDEGAKYIGEALRHKNCKLNHLNIIDNNIRDEGAKYIGDEGAKYIYEALSYENCKLTQLDISFNNIGDEGAKYIGEEGAKYICEVLAHEYCKLTQLDMFRNNIGDEGAKYIEKVVFLTSEQFRDFAILV
ncbi:NACHT, LRR and PYD domains-containing protein 3-like [Nematostella vectensis]|uniref:NACHT, LRR and PYD domains-containing protein 3-like n=1 Tax=Nematostella vectensis TaxID=45351 RepID=UPI00207721CC|nr:NACHT, LRR and PYD domains-containing protein 3-like [Nematostella vectensis]